MDSIRCANDFCRSITTAADLAACAAPTGLENLDCDLIDLRLGDSDDLVYVRTSRNLRWRKTQDVAVGHNTRDQSHGRARSIDFGTYLQARGRRVRLLASSMNSKAASIPKPHT